MYMHPRQMGAQAERFNPSLIKVPPFGRGALSLPISLIGLLQVCGEPFMKLPVFKAVATTFAFTATNFLDLIKIVWAPIALMIVLFALIMPGMGQSMLAMSTVDPGASSEEAMTAFAAMAPMFLLLFVISIAFYLVVFAGVLKLVVHGEKPKLPFYIGFGGDELRLLGTWLLLMLIFIGAYIGVLFVFLILGFLVAAVPAVGIIILPVGGIAALVVYCWLMLRMSLATPATVGQRTIGLGPSWNASKGNVWRLLGYWLIWGLIFFVIQTILIIVLMPGYFEAMGDVFAAAGTGSVEAVDAASQRMNEVALAMYDGSPAALARTVAGIIIGTLAIVVLAVAGGVAWRLMTETSPEKHFE
jgi:hypothetical protein